MAIKAPIELYRRSIPEGLKTKDLFFVALQDKLTVIKPKELNKNGIKIVGYAKFSKNENLRQILLSTEDEELVEDTTGWHDNIWGDCSCPKCQYIKGRNKLGKILMQVRDEIKTGKMQHP